MKLHIDLPDNLAIQNLVRQANIPCVCRIAESFAILFQSPLPPAAGVVRDSDITLIDERVPAAAGGEYIHHAFGMITIAKESPDIYSILALSMFNRAVGGAQSLWTESMGLSEVSGTLRSSQDGYTAIERLCLATPKEAAIHDYAPADRAECRTYSISTPRAV